MYPGKTHFFALTVRAKWRRVILSKRGSPDEQCPCVNIDWLGSLLNILISKQLAIYRFSGPFQKVE